MIRTCYMRNIFVTRGIFWGDYFTFAVELNT